MVVVVVGAMMMGRRCCPRSMHDRCKAKPQRTPTPKTIKHNHKNRQLREYIEQAMLALDPLERDVLRLMKVCMTVRVRCLPMYKRVCVCVHI